MKMKANYKLSKGLSLIELLVYIAILGIITMIATASFQSFLSSKQSSAHLIKLKALIAEAQAEAIDTKSVVTVCPTTNEKSCNSKNWSNEIIAFVDHNGDKSIKGDDQLIEVMPAVVKGDALYYSGFGSQKYLQFEPNGFFYTNNGTFKYCSMVDGKTNVQGIIISKTGRVRDAIDDKGKSTLNTGEIKNCNQISN